MSGIFLLNAYSGFLRRVVRNRVSTLSPLTPFISLPRYFVSEWSYAQYRIPARVSHISLSSASHSTNMIQDERCTVAWIHAPADSNAKDDAVQEGSKQEFQIIVINYSGGWYRLGLPSSGSSAPSQSHSHTQTSSKKDSGSRPASVLGGSPLPSSLAMQPLVQSGPSSATSGVANQPQSHRSSYLQHLVLSLHLATILTCSSRPGLCRDWQQQVCASWL